MGDFAYLFELDILDKNTAMKLHFRIKPSNLRLKNYNGSNIQIFGQTTLRKVINFQVNDFNAPCVLGHPTIEELSRIKKVNVIKCEYKS